MGGTVDERSFMYPGSIMAGWRLDTRARLVTVVAFAVLCGPGCSSMPPGPSSMAPAQGAWDPAASEDLTWHVRDAAFSQDRAVEASGLTASQRYLYVALEKYAAVLQIDLENDLAATTLHLTVPPHSELEGIAWVDDRLLLCDEAHAAVYSVPIADEAGCAALAAGDVLKTHTHPLRGVSIRGGKIGLEGVAVNSDASRVYLLLERSRREDGSCVSRIFPMGFDGQALVRRDAEITIPLEDCAWRLTDLMFVDGVLLALKTQYPGERYAIIEIDPATGSWQTRIDLTDFGRGVSDRGFDNNLEGMTLAGGGDLYLVSDNAVTDLIDDPTPPLGGKRSLFVRLPARRADAAAGTGPRPGQR
jgi:hypothetical protein